MDWAERQEYYDLIDEEIQFSPKKGQKWILTFEERHTYQHDIVFHVYSEKGEYMMLVFEIVDVMELELKTRLHKLGDTLSGNFRILFSTLKADLPGELEQVASAEDGSRFKLTFDNKSKPMLYEWGFPKGDFKRIQPVLKLIWAVDKWRHGSKAMGWARQVTKEGKSLKEEGKKDRGTTPKDDKKGKKGRLDPFGSMWYS